MTQLRLSGLKLSTKSSGMSCLTVTPATDHAPLYSSRGSHTVTAKPLNSAMVAKYSVIWPAPMSSMRYSGPKVLVSCVSSICNSLGALVAARVTRPVFRWVDLCVSCPFSRNSINWLRLSAFGLNSSSSSKVPPQGRPKRCASSALMPYFN